MTKETNYDNGKHIVRLPIEVIGKIIADAFSAPISENCGEECNVNNAIGALGYEWSVVYGLKGGSLRTAGFCEYNDCATFVATQYGTDIEVLYVLKRGVPRKNVKVQVKARL